ncbi:maleylacetoacetate isomerase [Herbaspirillum hiltneri N3]|uniref:Maleylacetoacetate isomerase n=1 Tax=Herbaspirillum hiltneri N3 TaxID=1262470 RepID=A0ABN4HWQ2_9BURK|nr:maleylacetoacetate isomerase [Herbaspirillum hiltneri]AKZ62612.1 maleylacetoacetate isomerase [Herbaspirillum hiltneri N3]
MTIHLYSYFRSSASYRVRIALHLKGLSYDTVPVHLLNNGGEQYAPAFSALNPQSLVPVMEEEGRHITQSLAILEYLEERFPTPALLPPGLLDRAHVREIALAIACDIHPLNNLRVLRMLKQELGLSDEIKQQWIQHWITLGFGALETQLAGSPRRGRFCFGDTPTMADCCLIPQIFNARRFNVDMTPYPTLAAIEEACSALEAFQLAQPSAQPDAA